MTTVCTPTPMKLCVRHDFMVYKGWYDHAAGRYSSSCHNPQCDVHGVDACRRRCHRMKQVLRDDWGFRTEIVHFNFRPSPDQLKEIRGIVRRHLKGWDREAKIATPLHPKVGDWHLNIGVHSKWFFTPKTYLWLGGYVEQRLGYWDGKRYLKPSGRPRTADYEVAVAEMVEEIRVFCTTASRRRRQPRLERGRFENQPHEWLWYALRCKNGWAENEKLPPKSGYRLTSGFVSRGKKKHRIGILICLLLAAMLLTPLPAPPRMPSSWSRPVYSPSRPARNRIVLVREVARPPPARREVGEKQSGG